MQKTKLNRMLFITSNYAVLLVGAQKYYLLPDTGYPSYATKCWGLRFRPHWPLEAAGFTIRSLAVKYWLRV